MTNCDTSGLTPIDQAITQLLAHARSPTQTEDIPLAATLDRVLARDVVAEINVPPFDCSMMDGYALRSRDLQQPGSKLLLSQRIAAGQEAQPLAPGTVARIFTGAPLPAGADCVVMQEDCTINGDNVIINATAVRGDNVRRIGCHMGAGQVILKAGTRLRPQHLGLAASIGAGTLPVYRRTSVALLSTGDELAEPGQPLHGGQIYNSNRYMLKALLQRLQCEVIDLGTLADDLAPITETLRRAAAECDLIVSSGGVSVGEEDHIKTAIVTLGKLELWRLNIKPGKPLVFAHIGDTPLIGLPGNPVSSFVSFCLLARPFILKCHGIHDLQPKTLQVKADYEQSRSGRRREYLRATLHQRDDGLFYATPVVNQDSATLLSLADSHGLLCIPEERHVRRGDTLEFIPFSSLLE